MKQLVEYLVRGVVASPDAVSVHAVEGESSVLLELSVAPEDEGRVEGPGGDTLQAIRTVLSASAGRRKAVLELVRPGGDDPIEDAETEEGPPRDAAADEE